MAYIPQEVINEIRTSIDIVDVVGQYIQLSKRGNNYMASCPFHEDRNPSFSVSQSKQIYKCFSCGRGGNVFGFLQEIEGITFPEAVKKASEYTSIEIDQSYFSSGGNDERVDKQKYLYNIHEEAMSFYHYYLMSTTNGDEALAYLHSRDLSNEILERYQVGFVPEQSQLLSSYLEKEGFTINQMVESGIFYLNDNQELIDRFRGRIVFPLRNTQGKVVGFSGRVFNDKIGNQNAKYLNSPDTSIFDKSQLLFNFDQARLSIRQLNQVLVCEGYMDAMALDQAGYKHIVATMGTSLTRQHLVQLSKVAKEIVFVFDGDQAGQKATARAFELSQEFQRNYFKTIYIPNNWDPDEWIKNKGASSFQQLINQAESRFEFNRHYLKNKYDLNDDQGLAEYIDAIIQLIAQIDSPIEQQLRIQDLVAEYNLSNELIEEQVARIRHSIQEQTFDTDYLADSYQEDEMIPDSDWSIVNYAQENESIIETPQALTIKSKRAFQSEKQLLFQLIYHEAAWEFIEKLDKPLLLFHEHAQKAYFALQTYYYDDGNPFPLTGIVDQISDVQVNHFMTSVIWEYEVSEYHDEIMLDCIKAIDEEFIQLEIDELRNKMTESQKNQDYQELNELITKIMRLTRKIK